MWLFKLPQFWVIAVLSSLFYGFAAFKIFSVDTKDRPFLWWAHQIWFNFLGSLAGWAAFWFLSLRVIEVAPANYMRYISIWDAATAVVAFIGMTGHLPYTLDILLRGINDLAGKVLALMKK